MKATATNLVDVTIPITNQAAIPCVGHIVQINAEGQALVDFDANSRGPLLARSIIEVAPEYQQHIGLRLPVLLVFEDEDMRRPIIMGIIRDTVVPTDPIQSATIETNGIQKYLRADGETLIIDAEEVIELRCGKSSITMRKDGKIFVKGVQITNRASGANKIKGSTVQIN